MVCIHSHLRSDTVLLKGHVPGAQFVLDWLSVMALDLLDLLVLLYF